MPLMDISKIYALQTWISVGEYLVLDLKVWVIQPREHSYHQAALEMYETSQITFLSLFMASWLGILWLYIMIACYQIT